MRGSSPLFVLTCTYVHDLLWKDVYTKIQDFRRYLKDAFGLPVREELHTSKFLLNKKPYRFYEISDEDRVELITQCCTFLSQLSVKCITVVIDKTKIQKDSYPILQNAFTYSIQRLENDLGRISPTERFLIITDEGRLGKMRQTARKLQRINYIPSQFGSDTYRNDIKLLIEDPMSKNSKESYFIQFSDMVAYIVYQYYIKQHEIGSSHNRLPPQVTLEKLIEWLDILKPVFNLNASKANPYGFVCYPK